MITRHILILEALPEHPLYADAAYRLYAFLLEQLPAEESEWLHEEGNRMISQFLKYSRESGTYTWTVCLLSDAASSVLSPVLERLREVFIENCSFAIQARSCEKIGLEEFLSRGRENNQRYAQLQFQTVASFKQNGRYVLFPQERLILQNLMMRWNETFPMCPLEDDDAFQAILGGVCITDYNLRTARFSLKGIRIPGFIGSCRIDARLPLPLLELWNTLLAFADYSGIGIKTGLGMGGVMVKFQEDQKKTG